MIVLITDGYQHKNVHSGTPKTAIKRLSYHPTCTVHVLPFFGLFSYCIVERASLAHILGFAETPQLMSRRNPWGIPILQK